MSNYELRHITDQVGDDSVDQRSQQLAKTQANQAQTLASEPVPEVAIVGARDQKLLLDSSGRPIDKHKVVFFILLLHGIGTLMSWNAFINADGYFRGYKLSPTNGTDPSKMDITPERLMNLKENFLGYLSVAAQLPNVLFNGFNLLFNAGTGDLKLRINVTLIVEAIIFVLTIVLAAVDSSQWPGAFFYTTIVSVIVLNMASGIYQNCVFSLGAKFPGNYTNAILIGSNLCGTFTSVINLLSIWLAPQPQVAAFYYFIITLFVIIACLVSYNLLPMNAYYRHFNQGANNTREAGELEITTSTMETNSDTTATNADKNGQTAIQTTTNNDIPDSLRRTVDFMVPRPESSQPAKPTFASELNRKYLVFKQCWPQCVNVFLTFFVTLALFPAVMADIKGTSGLLSNKYFAPFACFFIFNAFAMIGNLISSWTTWPGRNRVWMMVLARFIFVPLFLFCNFQPQGDQPRTWPVLIESDIVYMLANVLFAASSGYLSSLCMMFASNNLRPEDAPTGGMLAAFFLVFGIFVGVNSSFIMTSIVKL